jgi:hypothetical protein
VRTGVRTNRARPFPIAIIAIIAALLLGSVSATQAIHLQPPNDTCEYFAETGHYVCEQFLEFYETRGGLEIFGYPLTEAFDDPARGLRVQYFQRARMEWHPHNPEPYKVQLGLLVDELGRHFPPASPEEIRPNGAQHRYFPETGHVVSQGFLDYFREKGGLDIFGYPRSEFMSEEGYLVQYFQRARMEWHPEDPSGPRMRLTNLGEIYIERFGLPGAYDEPLSPPARPGDSEATIPERVVTELHITASVRHIVTGRTGEQTVYVYATDQRQQAVEGASVSMAIHYPTGDQRYEFEPTDGDGFTSRSFDINPAPPGQKVLVDVAVTYGELTSKTQTFFLPWW